MFIHGRYLCSDVEGNVWVFKEGGVRCEAVVCAEIFPCRDAGDCALLFSKCAALAQRGAVCVSIKLEVAQLRSVDIGKAIGVVCLRTQTACVRLRLGSRP
jgi:hypothetical protein